MMIWKAHTILTTVALTAVLCRCATPPPASDQEALAEYPENRDSIEPANRQLFAGHSVIDRNVSAPIARGYRDHAPQAVRQHLTNFADPVRPRADGK